MSAPGCAVAWRLAAMLLISATASAQTIFSGPDITFTRPAVVLDPLAFENVDQITDRVAFARGSGRGLFNAADEAAFDRSVSPAGTRWATSINNPGGVIDAAGFADLTFDTWTNAYGGVGLVVGNLLTTDAVVHLVDEDIYLNLRFTSFVGGNRNNGAFSYVRSTAIPEPGSAVLALLAVVAGVARRR